MASSNTLMATNTTANSKTTWSTASVYSTAAKTTPRPSKNSEKERNGNGQTSRSMKKRNMPSFTSNRINRSRGKAGSDERSTTNLKYNQGIKAPDLTFILTEGQSEIDYV